MKTAFRIAAALAIIMLLPVLISAQVTFVVTSLPAYTPATDSLYIAGDFTGWQPGASTYMLHKNAQGKWAITLPAKTEGSVIKFKFTRGSWETVEKGAAGEELGDRSFTFGNGKIENISILNWADNGPGIPSTAASNVKVMDTQFYMPQLGRSRRIWIYLPPDYETSGKNYPVMYMHDGQNLFDVKTSYAGEWQVDETLNSLYLQGKQVPVVVGIDNGGTQRISEYTPFVNKAYGGGEGEKYLQFIVETLKPYIDQHYRTLPDRRNTAIMGSSLGGLISHYGGLAHQDVFGKAGIFSPSYWFSDSVWMFTRTHPMQQPVRMFQLIGTGEGSDAVKDMLHMSDSLVKAGFQSADINNKVVEGGQHNEAFWRQNFGEAYQWLFLSYITGTAVKTEDNPTRCIPNPARDFVSIELEGGRRADSVMIYDMSGRLVKKQPVLHSNTLDIRKLRKGNYILRCYVSGRMFETKLVKD